jgi:hypothetical protein
MSDNNIGNTANQAEAQEPADKMVPVKVPASVKRALTVKAGGRGKVSPYVRALIERDLAA